MNERVGKDTPVPSASELIAAMHDIAFEAQEEELHEIVHAQGVDPTDDVRRSRSAIAKAMMASGAVAASPSAAAEDTETVVKNHLGELFAIVRKMAGFSPKGLADRTGLSVKEIIRFESEPSYALTAKAAYCLEQFMNLPSGSLSSASKYLQDYNAGLGTALSTFSSQAQAKTSLDPEEIELLDSFIKHISARDEPPDA